jgi:CRP-like cAMP-binding protein
METLAVRVNPVGVSKAPRLGAHFQSVATCLDLGAGRRLCVQGARRREFGLLISGRARVVRDGVVVGELGAGDCFGDFTTLRGLPSPVTVVTEEPTSVEIVTGQEFWSTVGGDAALRDSLERTLDARIRDWVSASDAAEMADRRCA